MASVALIGPDGSGKTTLCRMLEQSSLLPFKYVYMGINYSASNVSLPTTRLVNWLRNRRTGKRRTRVKEGTGPTPNPGTRRPRGSARSMVRTFHLLAEEWYRALTAWRYERRGFVVLYDRHFVFDFAAPDKETGNEPAGKRLHRWLLARFFPRPDLVILLEAPGELLYARKGEFTPEVLDDRRRVLLQEARRCPNFVRVNVAQPLEQVFGEVADHVVRFCSGHDKARVMSAS